MTSKEIAAYIGSLIAILIGVALIWIPPVSMADQAGTFLVAGAFITGGLGGLGITVAIPAVRAQAKREVLAPTRRSRSRNSAPPPAPPPA